MKRAGPLLTLFAGLVVGLFMLSLNATTGKPAPSSTPAPGPSATAEPRPSPPSSPRPRRGPRPRPLPRVGTQTEYAGRTTDNTASVAISLAQQGHRVRL